MARSGSRGRASPEAPLALAEALLAASDPPDLALWAQWLASDAHLRLANRRVAVGRDVCLVELALLFGSTAALGRGFRELWPSADGETVLMEVDLTPASHIATIPVAIIVRMIQPQPAVREVRFYLDPTPLGLQNAPVANGAGPV